MTAVLLPTFKGHCRLQTISKAEMNKIHIEEELVRRSWVIPHHSLSHHWQLTELVVSHHNIQQQWLLLPIVWQAQW